MIRCDGRMVRCPPALRTGRSHLRTAPSHRRPVAPSDRRIERYHPVHAAEFDPPDVQIDHLRGLKENVMNRVVVRPSASVTLTRSPPSYPTCVRPAGVVTVSGWPCGEYVKVV